MLYVVVCLASIGAISLIASAIHYFIDRLAVQTPEGRASYEKFKESEGGDSDVVKMVNELSSLFGITDTIFVAHMVNPGAALCAHRKTIEKLGDKFDEISALYNLNPTLTQEIKANKCHFLVCAPDYKLIIMHELAHLANKLNEYDWYTSAAMQSNRLLKNSLIIRLTMYGCAVLGMLNNISFGMYTVGFLIVGLHMIASTPLLIDETLANIKTLQVIERNKIEIGLNEYIVLSLLYSTYFLSATYPIFAFSLSSYFISQLA